MEDKIWKIFVLPQKMTIKAYLLNAAFQTERGIESFNFWVPKSQVTIQGDFMLAPKWLVLRIEKTVKRNYALARASIIIG